MLLLAMISSLACYWGMSNKHSPLEVPYNFYCVILGTKESSLSFVLYIEKGVKK